MPSFRGIPPWRPRHRSFILRQMCDRFCIGPRAYELLPPSSCPVGRSDRVAIPGWPLRGAPNEPHSDSMPEGTTPEAASIVRHVGPSFVSGQTREGITRTGRRCRLPLSHTLILDNGSEFINHHLLAWCRRYRITFTRSRAWRKNDSAHVEQKNGAIVRHLIGYDRFVSKAGLCPTPARLRLGAAAHQLLSARAEARDEDTPGRAHASYLRSRADSGPAALRRRRPGARQT